MAADLGGRGRGPGAFDRDASGMGMARLGQRALPTLLPRGICRGNQTQTLQQFSGAVTTSQVTHVRHQGHGDCALHPTPGLESLNHRGHTPGFDVLVAFLCKTLEACGMLLHRTDVFLKDDVLRQAGRQPPIATAEQS